MIKKNADGVQGKDADKDIGGRGEESRHAELRSINERLVIASVRQQELADAAFKSAELYRLLARNFPNGMVLLFDHDLRHTLADGAGLTALGLSKNATEGKTIWDAFPPLICSQIESAYRAALAGETVVIEIPFGGAGEPGEGVFQIHALPVRDEAGSVLAGMAMVQDVTEQRRTEDTIRWQAYHDALTGLPNRALLRERLEQVLAMSERSGELAALLFLDLDHFKHINDTLGHAAGDRLLQAVATRLANSVRSEDTVARMGGDEFLALLPSLQAPEDAAHIAQKITALFAAPLSLGDREVSVTASVGVSLFPFDGRDAESLLRHADVAMYRSKERRRGGFRLYDEAADVAASERVLLEEALRLALARNEFVLLYQPEVSLRTGQISGVEALVRWRHPTLGVLPPARFIPVAEAMGLMTALGEWVLREACRQAVVWEKAGYPVPVVVNLSTRQFGKSGFAAHQVAAALAASGLDAQWLGLDVTENALLQSKEEDAHKLWELKRLGVRLCIDNFGTGRSPLSALRHFPVDALKMDRTFIRTLGSDPVDQTMARSIVDMAHSLHLEAIADGVETEMQRSCLGGMGCDAVLGYLFHHPLSAEQITPLLQKN